MLEDSESTSSEQNEEAWLEMMENRDIEFFIKTGKKNRRRRYEY